MAGETPVAGAPSGGAQSGMTVEVSGNADPALASIVTGLDGSGGQTVDHPATDTGQTIEPAKEPAAPPPEAPAALAGDLGEYDPGKPDTVAKYEQAFFTEAGKLNLEAFSANFDSRAKEGSPGELSAGERAFLNQRMGIDDSVIDQVIADRLVAREANASKQASALYEGLPGGKQTFDAAFAWGGQALSQAEKDTLDADFKAGGQRAKNARDLLVLKHQAATGAVSRRGPAPPPVRSAASQVPQSVTDGAPARPAGPVASGGYTSDGAVQAGLVAAMSAGPRGSAARETAMQEHLARERAYNGAAEGTHNTETKTMQFTLYNKAITALITAVLGLLSLAFHKDLGEWGTTITGIFIGATPVLVYLVPNFGKLMSDGGGLARIEQLLIDLLAATNKNVGAATQGAQADAIRKAGISDQALRAPDPNQRT